MSKRVHHFCGLPGHTAEQRAEQERAQELVERFRRQLAKGGFGVTVQGNRLELRLVDRRGKLVVLSAVLLSVQDEVDGPAEDVLV